MDHHSELPSTKDVLGEHLFSKILLSEPDGAEQITGVLLGASNDDILLMLEDQEFLKSQIEGVKRVLGKRPDFPVSNGILPTSSLQQTRDDMLGEELFTRVQELEPNQTAKVTGMILEMDPNTIKFLIKSPDDLREAVARAMAALNESDQTAEAARSMIEEDLYVRVHQRQPDHASAITGMLLEMDITSLQKLMSDPDLLEHKIAEALHVLQAT